MRLSPYLLFNGNCAEAFRFYEKCLGGKIQMMMTHGESPMAEQTPAGWKDKILHVSLLVGNEVLMGSDSPPEYFQKPQGFSVSFSVADPAEAGRIFQAMAEGGTIRMPIAQTFWSPRFGMLVDRFGVPWMISCDQPAGSPPASS
jgi:PhnB protein